MAQERAGTAAVSGQEGTVLTVDYQGKQLTARMAGFPASFQLQPGGRVILTDDPEGLTARPLVRAVEIRLDQATFNRERQIRVDDQMLMVQSGTLVDSGTDTGAGTAAAADASNSEQATAWVIESGDASPGQVIAVRWQQH